MAAIHRFTGTPERPEWDGVEPRPYDLGEAVAGTKRVLVGPDDGAGNFALRYFEIVPGGKSSLDLHDHDHGIVIVKGRARVLIGRETHELGPGDVAYIGGRQEHQLTNLGDGPLGFLCVNPARATGPAGSRP